MSTEFPYTVNISEKFNQQVSRTQALLKLEKWCNALDHSVSLAETCAESHVKGDTEVLCVKPCLADLIKNNPRFFDSLCEEGVVEWLSPLLLTKSSNRFN